MAIKKIKLPDNTTQDINDSRLLTGTGEFEIDCNGTGIMRIVDANGALGALPGCSDGNEDYVLASLSDLSRYLPLNGGTMKGAVTFNNGANIKYKDTGGTERVVFGYSTSANNLLIGVGTATAGHTTNLDGNIINLRYGTSHTTGFTLNSSGNVGIGTDSPAYKLDVAGNMRVIATGSEFAKFLVYPTNPYGIVFSSESNGTMKIQSRREASAQYFNLVLNPLGGNVGIGNTSPTHKLDVAGNINTTTGYYINGTKIPNITVSSSEPTSSDGSDGDIWIVI